MPDPERLLEDALEHLQRANRIDGSKNSYRKDNPAEYTLVTNYLNGGPRPNPTSDMGLGLVGVEDARRGLVVVEPEPEPEPPSGIQPPQAPITVVRDTLIGLNIAGQTQALWDDYDISLTADSGVIMGEIPGDPVTTLRRFKLRDIGARLAGHPTYAVHGIYCRRPNTVIEDFDVEVAPGSRNTDGFTLRHRGIVVNRFRSVSQAPFAMSYFEYDAIAGIVKFMHGSGVTDSLGGGGTGLWVDVGTQTPVKQAFYFEDVHFTVNGPNPKFASAAPGSYAGAGVTIKGCTVNGNPVTQAQVTNLGPVAIS